MSSIVGCTLVVSFSSNLMFLSIFVFSAFALSIFDRRVLIPPSSPAFVVL